MKGLSGQAPLSLGHLCEGPTRILTLLYFVLSEP